MNKKLVAILIVAAALRLWALFWYGDFWHDEAFSFVYSQRPWLDSLRFWTWETNPPLHMFFLKLWFYIFPANEFWARLPSLLFGTATVYFVYDFAKRIFNRRTALLAATFLAIHAYHIFSSINARTYALLMLLAVLSVNYFFKIFVEKTSADKKTVWLFAGTNLLLLYSHLTAWLVIIPQLAILLAINRLAIYRWLKINLIPLLLWSVWALPAFNFKLNSNLFNKAWYFQISGSPDFILKNLGLLAIGPVEWYYGLAFVFTFLGGLAFYLWQGQKTGQINKNLFYLLVLLIVPLTLVAINKLWNIRFFVVLTPWLTMIVAYLLRKRTWLSQSLVVILLAIMAVSSVNLIRSLPPQNNWQDVNNYVAEYLNPSEKQIFIYNYFSYYHTVNRYLQQPLSTLSYFPSGSQDLEKIIITQNYLLYPRPQSELSAWLKTIDADQYDQIFLLYYDHVGVDLPQTLEEAGWRRLVPLRQLLLFDSPTISLYEKPENDSTEKSS